MHVVKVNGRQNQSTENDEIREEEGQKRDSIPPPIQFGGILYFAIVFLTNEKKMNIRTPKSQEASPWKNDKELCMK